MDKIFEENMFTSSMFIPKEAEISSDCITDDTDYLLPKLKESFKKAVSVDIIAAFLMESGVKLLKDELKEVVHKI